MDIDSISEAIRQNQTNGRQLIALAGPPAAGKSTISEALHAEFGRKMVILPMDGFHLDNEILDAKNLRARKGAPETFDVFGFIECVKRVKSGATVYAPKFDRALDLSRGSAIEIGDAPIVLVEGNYLLLNQAPWDVLRPLWDFSIWLDVSLVTVEARCIERWLGYGLTLEDATKRARENDVRNAAFVIENSGSANFVVKSE